MRTLLNQWTEITPAPPPSAYNRKFFSKSEPPIDGFEYGDVGRRFVALIVDMALVFLFCVMVEQIAIIVGAPVAERGFLDLVNHVDGVSEIVRTFGRWCAIWAYYSIMESTERGATVGKNFMHLRTASVDGERLTFGRAALRNLMRVASAYTFFGYAIAWFTPRRQTIHDLVAKTIVLDTRWNESGLVD